MAKVDLTEDEVYSRLRSVSNSKQNGIYDALQNEGRESPRFQPWDERPIIMTFSGLIYIIEIWRCYVIKFMYR